MMRYRGFLFTTLLSLCIYATCVAQQEYAPKQGDVRIGMSGGAGVNVLGASFFDIKGVRNTSIGVGLDYLLTESFSLNLGFEWSEIDTDLGQAKTTTWSLGIGFYIANPSSTSNVLPFIRANYQGADFGGFKPSGFTVSGGAHIFANTNVSFDITLSYINLRASGETVDGFSAGVGLSVWFR